MRFLTASLLLGAANAIYDLPDSADNLWETSPSAPQNIWPPIGPQLAAAPPQNSSYEYVIVGSGPGGAPLAARLALAGFSVLLIEAGEDHGNERQTRVPALHVLSSEYDPIRWDYFVDHYADDEQARRDSKMSYLTKEGNWYTGLTPPDGAEKLGVLYPRVGALGGCAEHNALVNIRPNDEDWDVIAQATGDDSWKHENMLQWFIKLENNKYLGKGAKGHGFSGWLETTLTPAYLIVEDLKVLSLVIAACTAMGKGLISSLLTSVVGLTTVLTTDINADRKDRDTKDDIYQIPLSMTSPGYQRSTPRDFVLQVANATNPDGSKKYKLDIALNTLVTKVNFDTTGATPKATGVNYIHGKSLYRADPRSGKADGGVEGSVTASREVILSAGAFNTPQLLKLSGVGPREELERFDIPVVKDAPGVGGNMQDRYEVGVVGKAPSDFVLLEKCTFLNGTDPCYDQWASGNGAAKGSYTTNGIAFGWLHHSSVAGTSPDLFLGGVPAYFSGYFPGYATHALQDLSIWTWLTLKAHSRNNAGTVNLTSANPRDMPKITFNSFSVGGEEDLQAVYEGMKYGIEAFEKLVPLDGRFERVWPPQNISTEAELKQFAKDEAWGHHASCTAPIGAANDPMAVLDGDFKVRGVDGLRVVDASVFPKIPGSYICLAIYMISEKAASVIIKSAQA